MVLIYYAQVHCRWLPFTDNKGQNSGNYFKEKNVRAQEGKSLNWLHSILGRFSTDFRKLKMLSKHLLPQFRVSFSKSKSHSSLGTMQAWFPMGEPVYGCGSCLPNLVPTGFSKWELGYISHVWNSSLTGTLGCTVCLAPQLFLPVYLHTNVGPPTLLVTDSSGLPAAALSWVLSAQLPTSAPPTSLDECVLTPRLLDFHTVWFSVSSGCFLNCCCPSFGCAKRHSVST